MISAGNPMAMKIILGSREDILHHGGNLQATDADCLRGVPSRVFYEGEGFRCGSVECEL